MGTLIDLTNQTFGKLTVLERDFSKPKGKAYWICKCECGNQKSVVGSDLRAGKTASCGCGIKEAARNRKRQLEGQRFGRLLVIKDSGTRKNEKVVWECLCDCGNIVQVPTTYLTSGDTQSCGCLQKERTSESCCKDLTNQRFGSLLALSPTESRKAGQVVWKCICDCGNIHYVITSNLTTGHTTSCGCTTSSRGVSRIAQILRDHQIQFDTEYTFQDCRFSETNRLARFDFYVEQKYIIEFDGIQHFTATSGWNTQEKYEYTKAHDELKNRYCKIHNIPLIRIPYTHENQLTIEDLLLETSTFRIV